MKKLTLFLMLFLFLNTSFSQQSLDSLRLVLPIDMVDADEYFFNHREDYLMCKSFDYLQLKDARSGKELYTIQKHFYKVWFSLDDKFIYTIVDNEFQSRNILNGEVNKSFSIKSDLLTDFEISEDHRFLLTYNDSEINIWDINNGELVMKKSFGWVVNCAKFTANGECILVISDFEFVHIWNIKNNKLVKTIKHKGNQISRLILSPNANFAIFDADEEINFSIWNIEDLFFSDLPRNTNQIKDKITLKKDKWAKHLFWDISKLCQFSCENEFYYSNGDNKVNVINLESGRVKFKIDLKDAIRKINQIHLIPSSDELLVFGDTSGPSNLKPSTTSIMLRISTISGEILETINFKSSQFEVFKGNSSDCSSRSGNKLLIDSDDNISTYNLTTNTKIDISNRIRINKDITCLENNSLLIESYDYLNNIIPEYHLITLDGTFQLSTIRLKHSITSFVIDKENKIIITGDSNNEVTIWNSNNGKIIKSLKFENKAKNMFVDNKKKIVIIVFYGGEINIVNLVDFKVNKVKNDNETDQAKICPIGDIMVTSSGSTLYIWDLKTCNLLKKYEHEEIIDNLLFSPNGEFFVTTSSAPSNGGILLVWDSNKRKIIKTFEGFNGPISTLFNSNSNSLFMTSSMDDFINLWNIKTDSIYTLVGHNIGIEYLFLNKNENLLFCQPYFDDEKTIVWNLLEKRWNTIEGRDFCLIKNSNILITKKSNTIILSNSETMEEIKRIKFDNDFYHFQILDSEKVLLENNGEFKILDLKSGNLIYSLYYYKNNNYLVKLPNSPYYMCSKDASKMLHYVTPSLKVIGFEQLDPVYNRPDIVLDSIGKYFGNSDGGMIEEYRKSWEKRIDRLGLDKKKLGKGEIAVPNAEIVGADDIAYENKNGKLDIKVAANDPKYPLRRFNVYVNEVPLYGAAGISIAHLKKQVWDTTVSVTLSIGENKIQVSVMNELGLENFKYPSYVNYTPSEPVMAKTYYIGIGVNEFKESSHNLKYCVKDVTDLSTSFSGPNTEIKLFTNAQVTKENILALKDYLAKTTVNDKVIISCSSHGLLDDSSNFYLATHDVDFNNPKARGLKYEELENLLDGIPARQKLLLLDACNSGENDKTEVFKNELANNHNKMDSTQILAARGVIIKLEDENKSNFKKMNELFVNVRNNTGSVIISAAGGQESALEAITVDGKSIENGAFSYCVLEYLKNNTKNPEELTVNKIKNYVEKRVEEITNGKQQPTSRQETMEVDWRLR